MTEARLIVENFVDSMTHLMELLIKETSILNDKDFDGLESIQSRKLHLSRVYEDAQKRLQEQRDSVNCLNEEEREDLRKLYKQFRGVLSENMIVLRGSHDATENVIKIVIDAVKKSFPKSIFHIDCNGGYSLNDLNFFKSIDKYQLAFIEQPLSHDDLLDHSKLAKLITTPICLDESINSVERARQAIEINSCKYINIK